jgi:geranylgeranyl diphosphate synthase, type II
MTPASSSDALSPLVPELLLEYGGLMRSRLGAYLADRDPGPYLYDLVRDYPMRGGRLLRPSLCVAAARALGARLEVALPAAASVELLHNAGLIHDDVEDESEERRGRPTLHRLHGVPMAINAGDALMLASFQPLFDACAMLSPATGRRILEEAQRAARETAEGQALDLGWRRDHREVTEADYLRMVLKKTCWLTTIYPIRLGALVSDGDVDLDRFVSFGFFLGAAFQVQDDVLNLIGDHGRYGKEPAGDLWEGKRTLMLVHLLREATADERVEIDEVFRLPRERRDGERIDRVRRLMQVYGCVEYARRFAHGLAGAAANEFTRAFGDCPRSRDRDFIEQLVFWVLERS